MISEKFGRGKQAILDERMNCKLQIRKKRVKLYMNDNSSNPKSRFAKSQETEISVGSLPPPSLSIKKSDYDSIHIFMYKDCDLSVSDYSQILIKLYSVNQSSTAKYFILANMVDIIMKISSQNQIQEDEILNAFQFLVKSMIFEILHTSWLFPEAMDDDTKKIIVNYLMIFSEISTVSSCFIEISVEQQFFKLLNLAWVYDNKELVECLLFLIGNFLCKLDKVTLGLYLIESELKSIFGCLMYLLKSQYYDPFSDLIIWSISQLYRVTMQINSTEIANNLFIEISNLANILHEEATAKEFQKCLILVCSFPQNRTLVILNHTIAAHAKGLFSIYIQKSSHDLVLSSLEVISAVFMCFLDDNVRAFLNDKSIHYKPELRKVYLTFFSEFEISSLYQQYKNLSGPRAAKILELGVEVYLQYLLIKKEIFGIADETEFAYIVLYINELMKHKRKDIELDFHAKIICSITEFLIESDLNALLENLVNLEMVELIDKILDVSRKDCVSLICVQVLYELLSFFESHSSELVKLKLRQLRIETNLLSIVSLNLNKDLAQASEKLYNKIYHED